MERGFRRALIISMGGRELSRNRYRQWRNRNLLHFESCPCWSVLVTERWCLDNFCDPWGLEKYLSKQSSDERGLL